MKLGRALTIATIAAIGVIASLLVFRFVEKYEIGQSEISFQEVAASRVAGIENVIVSELTVVKAISALFESSVSVDRKEFSTFVSIANAGIGSALTLEWIPKVNATERERYEQAARADGYADFEFRDRAPEGGMIRAADRSEYYPVYYLEPYIGNEAALGFDLGSNPSRLAALSSARDTGEMVASERISLVKADQAEAGVLVFVPIFRPAKPRLTLEQRQTNLMGFAVGVFQIRRLLEGGSRSSATTQMPRSGIDLHIFDLSADSEPQLLAAQITEDGVGISAMLSLSQIRAMPHLEHQVDVGGRIWAIVASPAKVDFGAAGGGQPWAALAAMLIFTGLLISYLASVMTRADVIGELVDQRTKQLHEANKKIQDREQRISAVLDNVVDGIITIDESGVVETINPAGERIFGTAADEIIGRNVRQLMPEPYRSEHDRYLKNYRETGERKIIGLGREVQGLRSDGSVFPLYLAVSEILVGEERKFTGIVCDISDRQEAEKLKNGFISTVSHELRTPLTSIMGALGLIRAGTTGELPEKFSSMLEIAVQNSERLVRLINDILDIEKIEAGKMNFQMRELKLSLAVSDAIDAIAPYAADHGVTISFNDESEDALIWGDPDRLAQVFTNLLSNAAKYSPDGATVEITTSLVADGVRVSITDHGTGIPEDFRERIFEKFSQADATDKRQRGGTGLGLSITKTLVEHHGGTINYESQYGLGATFFVDFPVRESGASLPASAPASDAKDRILICEDDRDIAKLLQLILSKEGYVADIALNAAQANAMLLENSYRALTLDLQLPDEDGIALLRELRARRETAELPIIIVSANASAGRRRIEGEAVSVVDWLEKPIDQDRLLLGLKMALRNQAGPTFRVLHVEDDPDLVSITAAVVDGFAEVTAAHSFSAAQRLLQTHRFDLVILDLELPDGRGGDLLPQLRRPDGYSIPVIVFSAHELSNERLEGIHRVLVKSRTTNKSLLETIRAAVQRGGASGNQQS